MSVMGFAGLPVTERPVAPDRVPQAQASPRERISFPGESLSNPPGVRAAQELLNWRTGRQRLERAIQGYIDEGDRGGSMQLVPVIDEHTGTVTGKTYAHVPWTDPERQAHAQRGRAWRRYMETQGEDALQHHSHELASREDELVSTGTALNDQLRELLDGAGAGSLTADEFGERFNTLLHQQRRLTRQHRVYASSVEMFNQRRERGGYADQLDVLSNHPAVQGNVISALQTGDVPEAKLRYGHYEELDPEKVARLLYKSQKLIDSLDGELARLQDRDARRGRTRSSQDRDDRTVYPAMRTRM